MPQLLICVFLETRPHYPAPQAALHEVAQAWSPQPGACQTSGPRSAGLPRQLRRAPAPAPAVLARARLCLQRASNAIVPMAKAVVKGSMAKSCSKLTPVLCSQLLASSRRTFAKKDHDKEHTRGRVQKPDRPEEECPSPPNCNLPCH